MKTKSLRECFLSDKIELNGIVFEIQKMGEINLDCPNCNKKHQGFLIIGKNLTLSNLEFIIFQADAGCTEKIMLFQLPGEPLDQIRKKLSAGTVEDKQFISYFFETNFESRSELLTTLRRLFLLLNGEHYEELTGMSLYFDFKEDFLRMGGQYTVIRKHPYIEQVFREFNSLFNNLRKVEGIEAEKAFNSLIDHHITRISINYKETLVSPEQFLEKLCHEFEEMQKEGKIIKLVKEV